MISPLEIIEGSGASLRAVAPLLVTPETPTISDVSASHHSAATAASQQQAQQHLQTLVPVHGPPIRRCSPYMRHMSGHKSPPRTALVQDGPAALVQSGSSASLQGGNTQCPARVAIAQAQQPPLRCESTGQRQMPAPSQVSSLMAPPSTSARRQPTLVASASSVAVVPMATDYLRKGGYHSPGRQEPAAPPAFVLQHHGASRHSSPGMVRMAMNSPRTLHSTSPEPRSARPRTISPGQPTGATAYGGAMRSPWRLGSGSPRPSRQAAAPPAVAALAGRVGRT